MTIDLDTLKKLEPLPPSAALRQTDDRACLLVLVKLRDGAACPDYVMRRGGISACMFSAEISADTLARLDADDAVESVSVAKVLPALR